MEILIRVTSCDFGDRFTASIVAQHFFSRLLVKVPAFPELNLLQIISSLPQFRQFLISLLPLFQKLLISGRGRVLVSRFGRGPSRAEQGTGTVRLPE